jgi:hypothetical protein
MGSPPRISGASASAGHAALAAWGRTLTCYTSALGTWLSFENTHWWRPLATGGPFLAVECADELLAFEHHPRPLCPVLGLALRTAPAWEQAQADLLLELGDASRVLVAGDSMALPWHPAYGKAHAPHWFVLTQDAEGGLFAEDPLNLVGEWGPQEPTRIRVEGKDLSRLCVALPPGSRIHALRERAVLGMDDPELGAAYRWLTCAQTAPARGQAASCSAPPVALRMLAARLAERAGAPDASAQADDIWQALRQRELTVAALTQERLLGSDVPDPRRWQESLNLWRTLPPLLMHARMLARAGRTGRSATAIPDTLQRIADAEESCTDAAFPALPW